MTESVKIYPGTHLWNELSKLDYGRVLDWFLANDVDPKGVPADRPVTIDDVIDFWWVSVPAAEESDSHQVLERLFEGGGIPLSHRRVRVTTPLPADLASALREVASRRNPEQCP